MIPDVLPFLIVHGDVVWLLLCVLTLLVTWAGIWRHRRRRARDQQRLALDALGEPTPEERFHPGGPAVLEGVLTFPASAEAPAPAAAPAPEQERDDCALPGALSPQEAGVEPPAWTALVGDDEWPLDGPLQVELGDAQRKRGGYLDPALRPGDRVRVAGELEALSGVGAGYREAAVKWRLRGDASAPLRAVPAGPTRVRRPGFKTLVKYVLAVGIVLVCAGGLAGVIGEKVAQRAAGAAHRGGHVDAEP